MLVLFVVCTMPPINFWSGGNGYGGEGQFLWQDQGAVNSRVAHIFCGAIVGKAAEVFDGSMGWVEGTAGQLRRRPLVRHTSAELASLVCRARWWDCHL